MINTLSLHDALPIFVELIQHNAGADTHAAFFEIEIIDLAVVTRELDNQPIPNCVPNQAGARATRCHRNACIGGSVNDCARFPRTAWKGNSCRFDLVNRSVSRVKLSRQVIKPNVTTGLFDFPFLGGNHSDSLTLARRCRLESAEPPLARS